MHTRECCCVVDTTNALRLLPQVVGEELLNWSNRRDVREEHDVCVCVVECA